MSETISLIKNHVSVRDFKPEKLRKEEVDILISCAQSAPTASYLQAYSIISIDDPRLLKELVKQGHLQDFILEAGHFFIFCGDFRRHEDFAKEIGYDIHNSIEGIDAIMVGAIDASLAAQNLSLAAESMGLGTCFIGGVRDGVEAISSILQLPDYVFPIYGLAVGYPASKNDIKPRFHQEAVHHFNGYNYDTISHTKAYEHVTKDYYSKRSGKPSNRSWSSTAFKTLLGSPRTFMKDYLLKQKMGKH